MRQKVFKNSVTLLHLNRILCFRRRSVVYENDGASDFVRNPADHSVVCGFVAQNPASSVDVEDNRNFQTCRVLRTVKPDFSLFCGTCRQCHVSGLDVRVKFRRVKRFFLCVKQNLPRILWTQGVERLSPFCIQRIDKAPDNRFKNDLFPVFHFSFPPLVENIKSVCLIYSMKFLLCKWKNSSVRHGFQYIRRILIR